MIDRYACPIVDRIWTETATLTRWGLVERAASRATRHPLRSIPIDWTSGDWDLRLARFEQLEAQYGHDVAAFVEMLREHERTAGDSGAARWLHYGLCSSDVVDAGWLLGIRDANAALAVLTGNVVRALETRAADRQSPVVYRTHGQAAQNGSETARWLGASNALRRAAEVETSPPTWIGFDGPTGTGGLLSRGQREDIAAELGLTQRPHGEGRQAADREQWVSWLANIAKLATVCERIAQDIRLLSHVGVDEVREGRDGEYRGSSSMPHKHNPTRSERICGLAPMVRAAVNGYAEAAASVWGSHSLEHSSAERIAIPLVTGLTGFILTETAAIVATLETDDSQIDRNIASAPPDSYIERNRLIEAGADGGDAWSKAREFAITETTHTLNVGDHLTIGGREFVVTPSGQLDFRGRPSVGLAPYFRGEPSLMPLAVRDLVNIDTDRPLEYFSGDHRPSTADEEMTIEAVGTITPNVSAVDRDRPTTPPTDEPDPQY